jgi:hypothetical protein
MVSPFVSLFAVTGFVSFDVGFNKSTDKASLQPVGNID